MDIAELFSFYICYTIVEQCKLKHNFMIELNITTKITVCSCDELSEEQQKLTDSAKESPTRE